MKRCWLEELGKLCLAKNSGAPKPSCFKGTTGPASIGRRQMPKVYFGKKESPDKGLSFKKRKWQCMQRGKRELRACSTNMPRPPKDLLARSH